MRRNICNLIVVFDTKNNIVMCKRKKDPYKGLINFVGGHLEENENSIDAAYRELYEETNITKNDIELKHFMDFVYHIPDFFKMEVYYGFLNNDKVDIKGTENELVFVPRDSNFNDLSIYAGEGNVNHILYVIKKVLEEIK